MLAFGHITAILLSVNVKLFSHIFFLQVSYDGELHKHPQLEADLTAVREIYGPSAVSLRYIILLGQILTNSVSWRKVKIGN